MLAVIVREVVPALVTAVGIVVEHKGFPYTTRRSAPYRLFLYHLRVRYSLPFSVQFPYTTSMPRKPLVKASDRLEIRLAPDLLKTIKERSAALGYSSTGEYVRSLVKRDLGRKPGAGGEGSVEVDYEKVLVANQHQVLGALRKVAMTQRASMAFGMAFARSVFKYLPELPPDDAKPSERRADQRYAFVEKKAGQARFDLVELFEAEMERLAEPKSKV